MGNDHQHDHDHAEFSELSDVEVRVRALESLLTETASSQPLAEPIASVDNLPGGALRLSHAT